MELLYILLAPESWTLFIHITKYEKREKMINIKLTIEYEGTKYYGWQRQKVF